MKKLTLLAALLFVFSIAAFGQSRRQFVKIPPGKYSTVVAGVTNANNPLYHVIRGVKAGQTITIRVVPKNMVIGLLPDGVEADARKGLLRYRVSESQSEMDFEFEIGNGYSGAKYRATLTIK